MKNILVTIDFSENEQLVLDYTYRLAKAFESKVWLLHVAAPEPDFVGYSVGPQHIRDFRADELRSEHKQIQEYANTLKEKGIAAVGLLIQGATIEMIIEESKKLHVDLIIAGHHDYGFIYKAFISSISSEILKNSNIPLFIVPLG